ncbi:microtubule-associated protein futsch-like [Hylaeus volcanicus]|uniref:microtubule-associated protein futsch-like n=1 Tax=Hylaeus volcanicus TaxID=313075 RepID=UPI0023B82459|nr:microtubule-associated protein futsch-like [Hylaeus volcanicus]
MKLRTFRVLCYLCVLCALCGAYGEPDTKNRSYLNSSESDEPQEPRVVSNSTSPRDKRALGLILSGLAQVFGYNVSSVQLATLPNPEADEEARQSPNPVPPSSTTSTPATPKQRETIRFTGVLNFGNSTSLLNRLQEYENIFHGGSSVSTPAMNATTPSSTPAPSKNVPAQPLPPLLVNIPLPTISQAPLPTIPQSPLPEIPPQDIKLSYPEPIVIVRQEVTRNQTTEKPMVQMKNNATATSPPLPAVYVPTDSIRLHDPHWRNEYEYRLAELERKQEEQAERLRQQERYRNLMKDNKEEDPRCKNKEKPNQNAEYSAEDSREDSRESYESPEKTREYSRPPTKDSRESEEYSHDDNKPYKQEEDLPIDSYSNVGNNEPLPISVDDEQRRPEELRNSYGQLLNSHELPNGFASYFGKLKQSISDFYNAPEPPASDEASKEREDSSERYKEDENESSETPREENDPPTTKYEEYSLEEETDETSKENSQEDSSERKYSNRIPPESEDLERKSEEQVDYSKYMPLAVPVRYLAAPEESKRARSRTSGAEKSRKVDNVPAREASKRIVVKEARRPKKENLKPKIGIPERRLLKKLHEGEQKELQVWPAPFDFVLDSTIQTEVTAKSNRGNVKHNRKLNKGNEKTEKTNNDRPEDADYRRSKDGSLSGTVPSRQRTPRMQTNLNQGNSSRKRSQTEDVKLLSQGKEAPNLLERYEYNSNGYYRKRPVQSIQQLPGSTFSKRIESLKRSTDTAGPSGYSYRQMQPARELDDKSQVDLRLAKQRVSTMTFDGPLSDRNEHYYIQKQPESKVDNQNQNARDFQLTKQEVSTMTFKGPLDDQSGYYYSQKQPASEVDNKNQDTRDFQLTKQSVPTMIIHGPTGDHDLFSFRNDYGLAGEGKSLKSSGMLEEKKKIENEAMASLSLPQYKVYSYGETLTKFANEPESRSEKVGYYANSEPVMRISGQKRIDSIGPIDFIDLAHVL